MAMPYDHPFSFVILHARCIDYNNGQFLQLKDVVIHKSLLSDYFGSRNGGAVMLGSMYLIG